MYKSINAAVIGSINMDLILNMPKVPDSSENIVGTTYGNACGGKGANQAIGLARLGANVKIAGKVANDDNGKKLIENLKANNVDVKYVSTDGTQTGLAVILLDNTDNNRIIVYEGANSEIESCKANEVITGDLNLLLIQFETAENVVINAVNEAVKKNITTVIDCGPAKNFNLEAMQGATILSPNENEAFALSGVFPKSEESILEASKILMARSKAKFIVIKLGDRGCSLWNGKELKLFPAHKSNVVDTTAAGDCFTAALALEYIRSNDIESACKTGNIAGSISVSRMGAADSMPTADDIADFLKENI